jgi:hypothetical protein
VRVSVWAFITGRHAKPAFDYAAAMTLRVREC